MKLKSKSGRIIWFICIWAIYLTLIITDPGADAFERGLRAGLVISGGIVLLYFYLKKEIK